MSGSLAQIDAGRLFGDVLRLRRQVAEQGQAAFRKWRPRIERPWFRLGALNLGHYLAFRQHDLRPLQRDLMPLGLSSLGRAEGRVLASLDALIVTLAGLAGCPAPTSIRRPTLRQFFRGERLLARNSAEVFGAARPGQAGRILVTLGTDAAHDPKIVADLVTNGADAVRINCAHDDAALWTQMIAHVRDAERKIGWRIPVLMDIGGPKVRTANVVTPADEDHLRVGDELLLSDGQASGEKLPAFRTGCTLPQVFARLDVGHRISIDDGKLVGRIVRKVTGGFVARIEEGRDKGVKLKAEKGLNFPGVDLGLDPITERDRADLDFIARHADMVGYSFVETAAHVGEDHGAHAQGVQHAHAEGHLRGSISLVEVGAPGHYGGIEIAQFADDQLTRVAHGGGRRPPRDLGVRDVHPFGQFAGERSQAAAQHDADLRPQRRAALDVSFRVFGHSNIPAIQADMKLAMVPAIMAFNPRRARSDLREGASAPIPPT